MLNLCRLGALTRRELAALAAVFVLSLPAVTPRIYASDEVQYFSYLRSIWFDHDVSFENEYRYFYDRDVARGEGFHTTFLEATTPAGRRPNFGTIGAALLWSPFYAVGDLTARTLRAAGRDVQIDGFSQPYIAAVAYGSATYGFLAVLLSIGAARRLLRDHDAQPGPGGLVGGLLVWVGSPLLFYMYVAPPMSHACSAFAVAVFITIWLHVRRTWALGGVILLGVAAAVMAMVREQDLFFAVGPALDFTLARIAVPRGALRGLVTAAAGCLAFAVAFLPQLVAYLRLNGHASPSRLVTRKMTWTAPHAAEVLFSPAHGFFFWTPLAVAALLGLCVLSVRRTGDVRRVGLLALLMVAGQVYVGGSVESWSVAGAFGQRRFVALTVLLAIGLAALSEAVRGQGPRCVLIGVSLLCVWWNIALIALFATRQMDRKQLELGRNAYDVFVTIPRAAPHLAYRYFVNRESYYRNAERMQVP